MYGAPVPANGEMGITGFAADPNAPPGIQTMTGAPQGTTQIAPVPGAPLMGHPMGGIRNNPFVPRQTPQAYEPPAVPVVPGTGRDIGRPGMDIRDSLGLQRPEKVAPLEGYVSDIALRYLQKAMAQPQFGQMVGTPQAQELMQRFGITPEMLQPGFDFSQVYTSGMAQADQAAGNPVLPPGMMPAGYTPAQGYQHMGNQFGALIPQGQREGGGLGQRPPIDPAQAAATSGFARPGTGAPDSATAPPAIPAGTATPPANAPAIAAPTASVPAGNQIQSTQGFWGGRQQNNPFGA